MRILDNFEIKATVCLNAKAAELSPDAVKELHRRGHEIATSRPKKRKKWFEDAPASLKARAFDRPVGSARSRRRPCIRRNI
jgi:hypothetical protein